MPFLRGKYTSYRAQSLKWMENFFEALDLNGDLVLSCSEFRHITTEMRRQGVAAPLDDEECEALMEYLDEDNSRSVDWEEFRMAFRLLDDDEALEELPPLARSAIRKLQFASLPNPEKYLTMFVGMPSVARLSILAHEVATQPEHSLEYLLCGDKDTTACDLLQSAEVHAVDKKMSSLRPRLGAPAQQSIVPQDWEMQFEVQIMRVTGVPAEAAYRSRDVIQRGVRFCLCRTENPPTATDAGEPPEFLGNVVKLQASLQPGKADTWLFSTAGDDSSMDPDDSCFVRCYSSDIDELFAGSAANSAPEPTAPGEPPRRVLSPMEQIHLFVELVTTVRVRKDSGATKSPSGAPSPRGRGAAASMRGGFSEKNREDRSFRRGGTGTSAASADEDSKRPETTDEDGSHLLMDHDGPDDLSSELVTVEVCSGWAMIPLAAATITSANSAAALAAAGVTISTAIHIHMPSALSSAAPHFFPKTLNVPMYGGSPFALMTIDANEVEASTNTAPASSVTAKLSRNAWKSLRKAVGMGVKSTMTVMLKRLPTRSHPAGATGNGKNEAPQLSSFTKLTEYLPRFIAVPMSGVPMMGIYRRLLLRATSLPFNAATAPDAAAPAAAGGGMMKMFGETLTLEQQAAQLFHDHADGENRRPNAALTMPHHATVGDPIFSSFPRIIADPAASKVMFYLWSREMPAAVKGATKKDCAMADALNVMSEELFRGIVLRVWYAFSSPSAQRCRLRPMETIEDIRERENYMRLVVGVVAATTPGIGTGADGSTNLNASSRGLGATGNFSQSRNLGSTTSSAVSAAGAAANAAGAGGQAVLLTDKDILHTPFHTKELMWNRAKYL